MLCTNKEHMNSTCFIGIGSNLDNPLKQINNAISKLKQHSRITILKLSKLYLSKPHSQTQQPDYVNCAVLIDTSLEPNDLLIELENITKAQNKYIKTYWGPRHIDLDILMYLDNRIINTNKLTVPHPEMLNRDFVLLPLADLDPNIILHNNLTVSECLTNCKNKFVYDQIKTYSY